MANRVTQEDVLAVMDSTLTGEQVLPYINSANVWTTSMAEIIPLDEEEAKDASILFEIERWMSAHMISMTKERVSKEEGASGAYIKYAGDWGQGLKQTPYGQMVINYDSTGTLASLANGKSSASTYAVPGV